MIDDSHFLGSPSFQHRYQWVPRTEHHVLAAPAFVDVAGPTLSTEVRVAGVVDSAGFHMSPDGDWTMEAGHHMSDHCGSFRLIPSGSNMLLMSWESVLQNVQHFEKYVPEGFVLGKSLVQGNALVISHALFKVSASSRALSCS